MNLAWAYMNHETTRMAMLWDTTDQQLPVHISYKDGNRASQACL
jgi:hypothetical protein